MNSYPFAKEFNRVLTLSGLTVADVAKEMKKRGFVISSSSLSYWRSGRSLPRKKNSFAIVDAIEEICQVPKGTLSNVLSDILSLDSDNSAPFSVLSLPPENDKAGTPEPSRDIDKEIDWSFEARREVVNCFFTISADFLSMDRYVLLLVRPSSEEKTYVHAGSIWTEEDIPPTKPDFVQENIEGATLDKTWFKDNEHGRREAETVRLLLPPYNANELMRVAYSTGAVVTKKPIYETHGWHFLWPLRFYTCHVTFEGEVPDTIEWVMQNREKRGGQSITSTQVTRVYPVDNTVQITLEEPPAATGWFRWS